MTDSQEKGILALVILLAVCAFALAAQSPAPPAPPAPRIERVRFDGDRVTCFVIPSEPLSLTCIQDVVLE